MCYPHLYRSSSGSMQQGPYLLTTLPLLASKVCALYFDLRQKPRPVYNKKGLKQEKDQGAGDMQ